MRGRTLLGWPQPICQGYIDTGELTHRYPIADGLHDPFIGNTHIHLQICQITPQRLREDTAFYEAILLISAIMFRLRGRVTQIKKKR